MSPEPRRSGGDIIAPTSLCECCEKPTAEPIYHPDEGFAFCGSCAASLLAAERDALRTALIDAREAIAAVHHAGFDSERKRLATGAVRKITAVLNAE
jgi:hypothetical protein